MQTLTRVRSSNPWFIYGRGARSTNIPSTGRVPLRSRDIGSPQRPRARSDTRDTAALSTALGSPRGTSVSTTW